MPLADSREDHLLEGVRFDASTRLGAQKIRRGTTARLAAACVLALVALAREAIASVSGIRYAASRPASPGRDLPAKFATERGCLVAPQGFEP